MTDIDYADLRQRQSGLAVALGTVPGVGPFFKFGAIFAPPNNTTFTTWPSDVLGGEDEYPWLAAAKLLFVVSTSDEDKSGGTGAKYMYIEGVNASGVKQMYILELDGTTPVAIPTITWFRTDRCYVGESGSTGGNVGSIKVYWEATPGDGPLAGTIINGITAESGSIVSAAGQSGNGFYTVRKGEIVYIDVTQFSADASQEGQVVLRFRAPQIVAGVRSPTLKEGWRTGRYAADAIDGAGLNLFQGSAFGEYCDIEVMALMGTGAKASVIMSGRRVQSAALQDRLQASVGTTTGVVT